MCLASLLIIGCTLQASPTHDVLYHPSTAQVHAEAATVQSSLPQCDCLKTGKCLCDPDNGKCFSHGGCHCLINGRNRRVIFLDNPAIETSDYEGAREALQQLRDVDYCVGDAPENHIQVLDIRVVHDLFGIQGTSRPAWVHVEDGRVRKVYFGDKPAYQVANIVNGIKAVKAPRPKASVIDPIQTAAPKVQKYRRICTPQGCRLVPVN